MQSKEKAFKKKLLLSVDSYEQFKKLVTTGMAHLE